jgi:hypothetical protein
MQDEHVQRIESSIGVLDGRVDRVGQELQGLRQDVAGLGQDLRRRIDEGNRQMHVLHEDLVERIKALA